MNAYYRSTIGQFLLASDEEIIGKLSNRISADHYQQVRTQNFSWQRFLQECKEQFHELVHAFPSADKWSLLLEYKIPRLASRIDLVLLAEELIFVIEYKNSQGNFENAYKRQLEDYCLDLRDFHKESLSKKIIPLLLVSNGLEPHSNALLETELIKPIIFSNSSGLANAILEAFKKYHIQGMLPIDAKLWDESDYNPTPTIVQAAQHLFAGQGVENISRSHAEEENLGVTTDVILAAIKEAEKYGKKIICFVTGVPGAGKTLVGLNVVHRKELFEKDKSLAAYFSGNGPLIKVLREALTRDKYERVNLKNTNNLSKKVVPKTAIKREVKTHIQNLHNFITDLYRSGKTPPERIAIFDEAQRCWSADHFYTKNTQNQNRKPNSVIERKSEPELLLEIMDRHKDWSVMIALVGGGQEINTGEAGIGEWGRVIKEKFPHWKVMVSRELLVGDDSVAGNKLFKEASEELKIETNENLHLKVSQRSYKANEVTAWVNAVLNNDPDSAQEIYPDLHRKFPIYLTRNLETAKAWLRKKQSGTRRIGLIASSGAHRLKSYGISVKEAMAMDEPMWFLNEPEDVRSSYYLEIPATEFKIQGLEIDWAGLCWDIDFRRKDNSWEFKKFKGTKWTAVNKAEDRLYVLNKYRVLLTRAREGMVIWVPDGSKDLIYGKKEWYDQIADYLSSCGLKEV